MRIKLVSTVLLSLAIAACGSESDGNDGQDPTNPMGGDSVLPESVSCDTNDVCTVAAGNYLTAMTWAPDKTFLLDGNVFIGDGEGNDATLTILPGTQIFGSGRTALIIRPGSKIMAEGTASEPIVFTSAKNDGERDRGDWGGLIINGRAPVNCSAAPGGTCEGEGNSGSYGGSDPADNSGVLRYVRVEFAGARITDEDEYNGIALQGVGSGTVLEYIHLHKPSDDGIEFFGGSVNAKHILITGAGDDSLDWTFGWNGNIQFVVVQQYADEADRGIEADNNSNNNDLEPRSLPTISNATFYGAAQAPDTQTGLLFRRGTGAHLHNAIVANFENCLDIDDDATFNMSNLTIEGTIFTCSSETAFDEEETDPFAIGEWFLAQPGNSIQTGEMMMDPSNINTPDFRPTGEAINGGAAPSGSFFESVSFRGGVAPDADWTQGWTSFAQN